MSWLSNFVRPRIQALVRKRETPENLWLNCGECGQMIFHRDLDTNLHVCPHCEHHMRIGPDQRFAALFDPDSFRRIELQGVPVDPLKFKDEKRYVDRLRENRQKTGEEEAIAVAHGTMDRLATVIACQNFAFMGGSMGLATGEAMLAAARLAVLQEASLIAIAATGGARMQEGILSLMQMPRTAIAVAQVREAGLPYISVLTDPTTGGVTASFAMLGDITIAEPRALIGFAGPRVIQNTIRETLPEGFQRAEHLLDHGMIDMVVPRKELRATLMRLLDMLRRPRTQAPAAAPESATPEGLTPEGPTAEGPTP